MSQGDERHVCRHDVNGLRQAIQIAGVHALHHHHPWVLAQPEVQLAAPHVDGVDSRGAALKEAVREASRRCPDIGGDRARDIDPKSVQSVLQLVAAATGVARTFHQTQPRALVHHASRLDSPLVIHQYRARHHGNPCLLAAVDEAALQKQDIQPPFAHDTPQDSMNDRTGPSF